VPIDGVSMKYAFDAPTAPDRHKTQYFEILGNRAIYHDGWLAGTVHKAPWERAPARTLEQDVWELYDVRADFSLVNDLAAKQPDKLRDLQALFMKEAEKNRVLPIDDRVFERFDPQLSGRPDLMAGRTSMTLGDGMVGLQENVVLNLKNKSVKITADIEVPASGANGTIIAQGGRFGGWSLYAKDGKPAYDYNFLGLQRFTIASPQKLAPGKATVVFDFAYDGGGMAKGGTGTLSVNGKQVAQGRIERTQPAVFSVDDTADVGIDLGTPVVETVGAEGKSRFTGRIPKVLIEMRDASPKADAAAKEAQGVARGKGD
jgi:arylsulfatase